MSKTWPILLLGEVLKERQEIPSTEALAKGEIHIVAKIGFNDGKIQLRSGSETKTDMILIRPGDLLISGINAAKGAIAIYGEENADPIAATIHYGAYLPNKRRVNVKYLWWYLRSGTFRDLVYKYVPGGIKTELKAKRLLPIPTPLPSIEEQRRIVAKIDELTVKIEEARRLHQQAVEEAEAFVISVHIQLAGSRKRKLGDILTLDEDEVAVRPTGEYPQVGLKGFGVGLFAKSAISGTETTYRAFNRLYEGAVVLSQVKGWEGAIDVCGSQLAGWFVSPEYRTFRCIPGEALPGYLATLVRTKWFWGRLQDATRGVGARRERTRPEQFLAIDMPMPDVVRQKFGQTLFAEVDVLKRLQADTATKLDALTPSILDKAFKGEL